MDRRGPTLVGVLQHDKGLVVKILGSVGAKGTAICASVSRELHKACHQSAVWKAFVLDDLDIGSEYVDSAMDIVHQKNMNKTEEDKEIDADILQRKLANRRRRGLMIDEKPSDWYEIYSLFATAKQPNNVDLIFPNRQDVPAWIFILKNNDEIKEKLSIGIGRNMIGWTTISQYFMDSFQKFQAKAQREMEAQKPYYINLIRDLVRQLLDMDQRFNTITAQTLDAIRQWQLQAAQSAGGPTIPPTPPVDPVLVAEANRLLDQADALFGRLKSFVENPTVQQILGSEQQTQQAKAQLDNFANNTNLGSSIRRRRRQQQQQQQGNNNDNNDHNVDNVAATNNNHNTANGNA